MSLGFDVKYTLRLLTKSWGYTLLCVGVVGLSMGLVLWTYSLVYGLGLQPLKYPDSDRWYNVQMASDVTEDAEPAIDAYTYQQLLRGTDGMKRVGAYSPYTAVLSEAQANVTLRAAAVDASLLAATRETPLMGRLFQAADQLPGAAPAAILSFRTWANAFASDPNIIGREARIDGKPLRIVGVMRQDFYLFRDFEIWLPLQPTNLLRPADSSAVVSPFLLFDEGQGTEATTQALQRVVSQINKEFPDRYAAGRHIELIPARLQATHQMLEIIGVIGALTMAILLLGCMNISLVFLARFLERSREFALRVALGASRSRLMVQCLAETALIVVAGVIVGFALANLGVAWARGIDETTSMVMASGRSPNLPTLQASAFVVAVLGSAAVWLLSTLLPAWRVSRQDAAVTLGGTGKGSSLRGSSRVLSILVGLQVLIASIVLVICGNLVVSIGTEGNKPTGVDSSRTIVSTRATEFDARFVDAAARQRYWDDLGAAVSRALPGSQTAIATDLPTMATPMPVALEGVTARAQDGEFKLPMAAVSENYAALLGIKIVAGRWFDNTDGEGGLRAAVLDEKTAQRYWPGQNPLGKRVQLDPAKQGPWLTVIGVASAVGQLPFKPEVGMIYQSLRQASPSAFQVMVKVPADPATARAALRTAAFEVDRTLVLQNLQVLDDYLGAVISQVKAIVPVFAVIAVLTAALAASGVFGLITRSVAQRTQEVGIRRALGATRMQATWIFLRGGAGYILTSLAGIVLGVAASAAMGSIFTSILEHAPAVAVGVFCLTAVVIASASYLPTLKVMALEPGDALRHD
jgi:putative ABC transport system permease protein